MTAEKHVTTFAFGENVVIDFYGKEVDATALANAATQTITINVSKTKGDTALITAAASPHVVLVDVAAARWTITLDHVADILGVLSPDVTYQYSIWSVASGASAALEQATGRLVLRRANGPTGE